MNPNSKTQSDNALWRYWRGLGGWNLYFLAKFALLWFGYLNFHALPNPVFMAFLLMPIPSPRLHRWRHYLAIPIGIALFYHDTGCRASTAFSAGLAAGRLQRPVSAGADQPLYQLADGRRGLRAAYRLPVRRAVGARHGVHRGGAGVAQYRQHRRAGGLTAARHLHGLGRRRQYAGHVGAGGGDAAPADSLPPTSANLTAYLNQFYEREKGRATAFPATLPADAQPFDLLVINICSLARADMDAVNLQNHPLWSKMDIMFDSFNSATAYSGPAAIRLLRASCGQLSHHDLYQPVNQQCYLFDNRRSSASRNS